MFVDTHNSYYEFYAQIVGFYRFTFTFSNDCSIFTFVELKWMYYFVGIFILHPMPS